MHRPDRWAVGIGFANEEGCFYVDLTTLSDEDHEYVQDCIRRSELIAYNVMFDGVVLARYTGQWNNWFGDAYAIFKLLSSDGWKEQRWKLETAQLGVLGWDASNKGPLEEALKERGLGKEDMYLLPASILGPYCASDADSAWQLWEYCVEVSQEFPEILPHIQQDLATLIKLLAEQQLRGMYIDQPLLKQRMAELVEIETNSAAKFLAHPEVAPHIEEYMDIQLEEWRQTEPDKFKKDGGVSARWVGWEARGAKIRETNAFNLNSKKQLTWLFFEQMGLPVVKKTPTGNPCVDRKVLPNLHEAAEHLVAMNKATKEMGYVAKMHQVTSGTSILHPQFMPMRTVSGRLGGTGGINLQQIPKSKGYLQALRARDGFVLVDADVAALEPCVLAELSRDDSMWKLYGPGAKPNDLYLYVAAHIEVFSDEIRKWYDPENPTKESVSAAKKHCKRLRNISKVVCLSSSYGAGATKIHSELVLAGIDISLPDVRKIHRDYWRLFRGVKRFGEELERMWSNTGGWVPSLFGLPLPVDASITKDLVNRVCQASGHQYLMRVIYYIDQLRRERKVEMYPWFVDYHDETIWEVPEAQGEAACQVIRDAVAKANEDVKTEIVFKMEPEIGRSMADFKGD